MNNIYKYKTYYTLLIYLIVCDKIYFSIHFLFIVFRIVKFLQFMFRYIIIFHDVRMDPSGIYHYNWLK